MRHRRVTVHDQAAEVVIRTKKRLTDPQQVLRVLTLKRHPRPQAGMNIDSVLVLGPERETSKEAVIELRDAIPIVKGQAEGAERGQAAVVQPVNLRHLVTSQGV